MAVQIIEIRNRFFSKVKKETLYNYAMIPNTQAFYSHIFA